MTTSDDDFPALSGLVTGYFHQDMDLEYDSIPQAVAGYTGFTDDSTKQQLRREMDTFLERYHNDLEGEFSRRYWFDFTPEIIGQTVPEFFDMVRTILADPESYRSFEPRS